jgi:hypothetical protein
MAARGARTTDRTAATGLRVGAGDAKQALAMMLGASKMGIPKVVYGKGDGVAHPQRPAVVEGAPAALLQMMKRLLSSLWGDRRRTV